MGTNDTDNLVPLVDAAARCRVSYFRLWDWVIAGKVQGRKVGRRWMVPEAEVAKLERWMAEAKAA